jgi:hypothetical protein
MKFKLVVTLGACVLLLGCATTYTYDGQRYASKEELLAAVDQRLLQVTETIKSLPHPVSSKQLVFAVPTEAAAMKQSVKNFEATNGRMIGLGEQIILGNITAANVKTLKVYFDAIKKRNIYQDVRFVDLDTTSAELQSSANEDVLFYSEPRRESGQFYYVSSKSGKQAFAWDKAGATMEARVRAFVEAVQAQAVRD